MKMRTANKNWTVSGINLIPSDAIYQKLVAAIESGNLSQQYLQRITGSNAPISVDVEKRIIAFSSF